MASPQTPRPILVVEDDRALREFYATALKIAGYDVVALEDGLDALRWLDQYNTPSLIILDLNLVRVSGHDLQRELRARSDMRHVPIVVVTGEDVSDLDRSQVVCVLQKPVTSMSLTGTVARCLRGTPAR